MKILTIDDDNYLRIKCDKS